MASKKTSCQKLGQQSIKSFLSVSRSSDSPVPTRVSSVSSNSFESKKKPLATVRPVMAGHCDSSRSSIDLTSPPVLYRSKFTFKR